MKASKIILTSLCIVLFAGIISGVIIYLNINARDTNYLYFKQDNLNIELNHNYDLSKLDFKTNIKDCDDIQYTVVGDTVSIKDNNLIATKVGSSTLVASVDFGGTVYKDELDVNIYIDNIESVLTVNIDAEKDSNDDYIMYVPNGSYDGDLSVNVKDINIKFMDEDFVSPVEFYVKSNPTKSDKAFNDANNLDNKVAVVKDNKIYAIGVGSAKISCYFVNTNINYSFYIKVLPILPTEIDVESDLIKVCSEDKTFELNFKVLPEYAIYSKYDIYVDDTDVVCKYHDNVFLIKEKGSCNITITINNVIKTIKVVVADPVVEIKATISQDFVKDGVGVIQYSLHKDSNLVDGNIGIKYIVDGKEYDSIDCVKSVVYYFNTIEFSMVGNANFIVRLYNITDPLVYTDVVVNMK